MRASPENPNVVGFSPIMPNLHSGEHGFLTRYASAGTMDAQLTPLVHYELPEMDVPAFAMGLPLIQIPGVVVPTRRPAACVGQERKMMADYDTFMFYAGTYPDVESAEADYQAVKDLYYDLGLIDTFDAAVVGKKDDGKVKIYKKHEQPTRHGGWVGAGWGLATGLAVALFPAAAIGGGLLAGTTAAGAGIGAIAGHVSGGMNRGDLKDLGDLLDEGQAALVVAAATNLEDKVREAMKNAEKVEAKEAKIDAEELENDSKAAQDEASSSDSE